MREINAAGLKLLTTFEGRRLVAYQDQGGVWTIGYGHTGPEVQKGTNIGTDEAISLLQQDLEKFYHLDQYLTEIVNDNQYSALICLAYNIGLTALKTSNVLRLVNEGEDPTDVWLQWDHINGVVNNGLLNRRKAELKLYFTLG